MKYKDMPFDKLRPRLDADLAKNLISYNEACHIVSSLMKATPKDTPLHRRLADYLTLLTQKSQYLER